MRPGRRPPRPNGPAPRAAATAPHPEAERRERCPGRPGRPTGRLAGRDPRTGRPLVVPGVTIRAPSRPARSSAASAARSGSPAASAGATAARAAARAPPRPEAAKAPTGPAGGPGRPGRGCPVRSAGRARPGPGPRLTGAHVASPVRSSSASSTSSASGAVRPSRSAIVQADAQHPVEAAGRQRPAVQRRRSSAVSARRQPARRARRTAPGTSALTLPPAAGPALRPPRPGRPGPACAPGADGSATPRLAGSAAAPHRLQLHPEVDPVQQRAGEPARGSGRRASGVQAQSASGGLRAGARIRRQDELDPGRVPGAAAARVSVTGPLQRLAQRVERAVAELRGLVQEQDAAVGQRQRARPGQARCRRRPARPLTRCGAGPGTAAGGSAAARRQHAGDGVQGGDLQRGGVVERAAGSTAAARRAWSCRRRAGRAAPDGGRRRRPPPGRSGRGPARRHRPGRAPAAASGARACGGSGAARRPRSERDQPAQRVRPPAPYAGHHRRLGGVGGGHHDPRMPARAAAGTIGRTPRTGPDAAVEAQLADHAVPRSAARRSSPAAAGRGGDRQVERRSRAWAGRPGAG